MADTNLNHTDAVNDDDITALILQDASIPIQYQPDAYYQVPELDEAPTSDKNPQPAVKPKPKVALGLKQRKPSAPTAADLPPKPEKQARQQLPEQPIKQLSEQTAQTDGDAPSSGSPLEAAKPETPIPASSEEDDE
jgi:hypothetical protein